MSLTIERPTSDVDWQRSNWSAFELEERSDISQLPSTTIDKQLMRVYWSIDALRAERPRADVSFTSSGETGMSYLGATASCGWEANPLRLLQMILGLRLSSYSQFFVTSDEFRAIVWDLGRSRIPDQKVLGEGLLEEAIVADFDQPLPTAWLSAAFEGLFRPTERESVPLDVDPDDYPLE